jgi:hypothetical protein
MTTLIHITNADLESSIKKNGIKIGKKSNIVFFMPVTQNYLISHQWTRELKRSGIKNFIAVYFKINKTDKVWHGQYFQSHKKDMINSAVAEFNVLENQLGYEFFIDRKIEAKEIVKINRIPKPMGWRYSITAHGTRPCGCPMCLQFGGYKTKRFREEIFNMSRKEAKVIILNSNDDEELWDALSSMPGKKRKESPEYLERLLSNKDEFVQYALAKFLTEFWHPLAIEYMNILRKTNDKDIIEIVDEYLSKYKK